MCHLVFIIHLVLYCMTLLFPRTYISWKWLCVDYNRKKTKDCYSLCPCLIWKVKCTPPNTPWAFLSPVLPPGMNLHPLFGPCPALVTPMNERCQCTDHALLSSSSCFRWSIGGDRHSGGWKWAWLSVLVSVECK